jgi:hypothetical protein
LSAIRSVSKSQRPSTVQLERAQQKLRLLGCDFRPSCDISLVKLCAGLIGELVGDLL